jgi:hypothetical protein
MPTIKWAKTRRGEEDGLPGSEGVEVGEDVDEVVVRTVVGVSVVVVVDVGDETSVVVVRLSRVVGEATMLLFVDPTNGPALIEPPCRSPSNPSRISISLSVSDPDPSCRLTRPVSPVQYSI